MYMCMINTQTLEKDVKTYKSNPKAATFQRKIAASVGFEPTTFSVRVKHLHGVIQTSCLYMIKINEPQLPWLRTAIYHTGLDVKMEVTQCADYLCIVYM